jgi:hypothetical protein
LGWGANKRAEPTKHAWRGVVPFLDFFFKIFLGLKIRSRPSPILALIALAVVGRRASATFRFFVMAVLDPAIHENAKSRNQANDNFT